MATYYNPKIITNNIEFSVDAANIKSWSGPSSVPAGTDYGYFGGGSNGSTNKSSVDRIDYASDTPTAATKGPLDATRYALAATGNGSYGYFAGGRNQGTKVDRFDYSNDTAEALDKGSLNTGRYRHGAVGNNSYGYFGGGNSPSYSTQSTIDRVDFSNDTATAAEKGPLSSSTFNIIDGTGNSNFGYLAPGGNSIVHRIDYSNDTATAGEKGPLSRNAAKVGATGNASFGYFAGGAPSSDEKTTVDRLDYSSDTTTASVKGPLAAARYWCPSTGSSSFGYIAGGAWPAVSNVDRIDYSNDTATAAVIGPLTITKYGHGAASPRANALPTSSSASIMHDITGKGNDVTLVGATFSSDKGGYFVFDGTNDRADTSSDMFDPNADFTFSAWVNADVLTSTNIYTIISDYNNTGSFKLRYKNGSGMQIVDSDVTIVGTFSDSTISTSTWYNVTVTRSSNTYTLYLNGNSISTITSSNAYDHGAQTIGATHSGASQYWDGKISAIISYSKALTAPEVQNNFNATRTRFGV